MKDSGRIFWGLLLVFLGLAFIFDQLGFGFFLSIFWPLVLLALGVWLLIRKHYFAGILLSLLGVFALLSNIFGVSLFSIFWPVILIAVGLLILFRHFYGGNETKVAGGSASIAPEDMVDEFVIFWGLDQKITSKEFKGGKINCFFGGAKLDLRNAKIAKEGADLEISAGFGGVEILVGEDARVESDGTAVFGGWTNKFTQVEGKNLPVLKIHGSVVFGGVEVK